MLLLVKCGKSVVGYIGVGMKWVTKCQWILQTNQEWPVINVACNNRSCSECVRPLYRCEFHLFICHFHGSLSISDVRSLSPKGMFFTVIFHYFYSIKAAQKHVKCDFCFIIYAIILSIYGCILVFTTLIFSLGLARKRGGITSL